VRVEGTAVGRAPPAAAEPSPDSALGRELLAEREITGALVTELAHDGDEAALAVLAAAGERLGVGIASIVNALNPEVVVVGGAAIGGGELLLEPARRVVAERALPPSRDQVRIERAELGEEAGMIGAAILAFEEGRV
jgi:glucokinase